MCFQNRMQWNVRLWFYRWVGTSPRRSVYKPSTGKPHRYNSRLCPSAALSAHRDTDVEWTRTAREEVWLAYWAQTGYIRFTVWNLNRLHMSWCIFFSVPKCFQFFFYKEEGEVCVFSFFSHLMNFRGYMRDSTSSKSKGVEPLIQKVRMNAGLFSFLFF